MRILFTGASSFTGCWFVRALKDAGHDVVATMTRTSEDAYDGLRRERVRSVTAIASETVWGCGFGDDAFLALLDGPIDALCHHGADVRDYKRDDFRVARALSSNTNNLPAVIDRFAAAGGRRVVITGSVFEGGEGEGGEGDGLPHFSPYGLSKSLTSEVFRYYAQQRGLRLGKFVIANPFGPLEEPRFTNYLMKAWHAGQTPCVRTPAYTRDNIHIGLLAKCYERFVSGLPAEPGETRTGPSGYRETQGEFTRRVAEEMRPRLGLACEVEFADQADFPEPRVRVNTDTVDPAAFAFSEKQAWDAFAEYYAAEYSGGAAP